MTKVTVSGGVSTTIKGHVRAASQAEVDAGGVTNKYVSPATLTGYVGEASQTEVNQGQATGKYISPAKRIGGVSSTTTTTTLTPDLDLYRNFKITALASDLTIANPIGTFSDFHQFKIRIYDNGTSRLITFGDKYIGIGGASLPISVDGGVLIQCTYNEDDDTWETSYDSISTSTVNSWYVRPSSGNYGVEDGTSYSTAWSGFSAIVWSSIQPGDTLYVAGTHTESLNVAASGVSGSPIIISSYTSDPGIIDSQDTRTNGLLINNYNYITLIGLKSIDAVDSCFKLAGTSSYIDTYNLEASGSGDQGIQNYDTVSNIYHYNAYCHDNFDDGISSHSTVTDSINVVGGTMENNGDGLGGFNIVATGVTFTGNTDDVDTSGVGRFTNCDFTSNVFINSLSTGSVFNGCTFTTVDCNGVATINSAIIPSLDIQDSTSDLTLNDCLVVAFTGTNENGTLNFNRCYIRDHIELFGTATLKNCLTDIGTDHHITVRSGGTASLLYHSSRNMGSVKYALWLRAGGAASIDNSTICNGQTGSRGILAEVDFTIDNTILTGLTTGIFVNSGITVTTNTCCFFGNSADTGGTGTVTQNGSITTDPLLTDPANNDFSLGAGSSCDGTGTTLTNDQANASTTDWGDGSTETPTVNLTSQSASWDIGAFVR